MVSIFLCLLAFVLLWGIVWFVKPAKFVINFYVISNQFHIVIVNHYSRYRYSITVKFLWIVIRIVNLRYNLHNNLHDFEALN
ncbi:hypothetical protein C2G38_2091000, partial [Gigaspora rosea]